MEARLPTEKALEAIIEKCEGSAREILTAAIQLGLMCGGKL
jgi:hypothetical protein